MPFPLETAARLFRFRCSRRCGSPTMQRKDRVYIPYSLSSKVIEWKPKWFYVENQWDSLPTITSGPPIQWLEWNKKPVDESQIPELLERIAILRKNNLT